MNVFGQTKIKINLPILIDSRMLLCANSGGGKSYTIRKILEESGNNIMSIVLDVEGEFKTLREKYDYLLIGQTGDVPISIKAAHLLPQKLMELNVSTIIDISDFKMHERVLYVKKFLESLMDLPKKFWKPCLIVVDEAHMYCGQQEKQASTHAVIDLMTRGRKRGYCGILATQRIAKLHKDAAAEANNYIIGRTGLDIDMKRAAEILGFTSKTNMLTLRNLKAGEFYVFGTAISKGVEKIKVSKVKTTHPKVGMDLKCQISPPTKKIKAMLSKLNDLPKEVDEKAKTTAQMQTKIRELKRELGQRPKPEIDSKQLETIEQRGYNRAKKEQGPLTQENTNLRNKLRKIVETATVSTNLPIIPVKPVMTRQAPMSRPVQSKIVSTKIGNADSAVVGRCERSILSLLYNNPQREFKKTMIGLFTGYSHKSGGFNNALSRLNALGLIRRNGKTIALLSENEAEACEILGTDINLHEQFTIKNWAQKLPRCSSKIFLFLMENPSDEFSKAYIGENTGYQCNSGGFNNAISQLNSLGLIIKQGGSIKLNQEVLDL